MNLQLLRCSEITETFTHVDLSGESTSSLASVCDYLFAYPHLSFFCISRGAATYLLSTVVGWERAVRTKDRLYILPADQHLGRALGTDAGTFGFISEREVRRAQGDRDYFNEQCYVSPSLARAMRGDYGRALFEAVRAAPIKDLERQDAATQAAAVASGEVRLPEVLKKPVHVDVPVVQTPAPMDESARRKATPVFSGVLSYFPDAIQAVARLSGAGSKKHNVGKPMHWAYDKSNDHLECIARHLLDYDEVDDETGQLHAVAVAWRALALLQTVLETNDPELHKRRAAQRDAQEHGKRPCIRKGG